MTNISYSVICQSIVGSEEDGFHTRYDIDMDRFPTRKAAVKRGFTMDRSDDFNIGVWDGDKLVSLDWMEQIVDNDPDLLREIQERGFA